MKVVAIVELPDDAFDDEAWGDGKWIIDDEGAIRYLEDGNCWMHYKDIDVDGIELRPYLAKKKENNGLKPLPKDESHEYYGCPSCRHIVSSVQNYCENCGQKLDWRDIGETE